MKKQKVYALMMSVYDKYTGGEQSFQVSLRRIYTSKEKAQAVCNRLLRETNLYKNENQLIDLHFHLLIPLKTGLR